MSKKGTALALPEAKTHAELAASKSSIWMNCPGYANAFRGIPKHLLSSSTKAADQGTAAHHLLEECLQKGCDAEEYEGYRLSVFENGGVIMTKWKEPAPNKAAHEFRVDEDMYVAVQECIDFVRDEIKRLAKKGKVIMKLEQRLYPLKKYKDMYGTGDITLSNGFELVVIDYKHGANVPVDAKGNTQIRYYGLGAARDSGFKEKKIKLCIVQPRCREAGTTHETISLEELKEWRKELKAAVVATEDPKAKFVPGSHCKWCEVKSTVGCPALAVRVQEEAMKDFEEVPDEDDDGKPVIRISADPDEVARVMALQPMVKAWLDGYQRQAFELARRGELPGYKIIAGRSTRKYKENLSQKDIARIARKQFGLLVDELYSNKLLSIAQLEKLVPAKERGKLNALIADKPPGRAKLVTEDHPGEALPMGAHLDFLEVDDDGAYE